MSKMTLLILVSFLFVSCKSKWQKEYENKQKNIQTLQAAVSAEYGQSMTLAKISGTSTEAYVIFKNDVTGEYLAYNLAKWDRNTMTTTAQYVADNDDIIRNMDRKEEWVTTGHYEDIKEYQYVTKNEYDFTCSCYMDKQVYEEVKIGERYVDDSGYYSFYYGGGFRFENTSTQTHDLETMAAMNEESMIKGLSQKFKGDFALSENRAQELANLSVKYMKLESRRELTRLEKDQFSLKALGVSMNQVETAMKDRASGTGQAYEALLLKAANVNRTTPELIGRFFDDMIQE